MKKVYTRTRPSAAASCVLWLVVVWSSTRSHDSSVLAFRPRSQSILHKPFKPLTSTTTSSTTTTTTLAANYLDSISKDPNPWSPFGRNGGDTNTNNNQNNNNAMDYQSLASQNATEAAPPASTTTATATPTSTTTTTSPSTLDPMFQTDLEEFLSQSKAHLQQAIHNFNHVGASTDTSDSTSPIDSSTTATSSNQSPVFPTNPSPFGDSWRSMEPTTTTTSSTPTAAQEQQTQPQVEPEQSRPSFSGSTSYMRDLLTPRHKQAKEQLEKGSSWTTGESLPSTSSSSNNNKQKEENESSTTPHPDVRPTEPTPASTVDLGSTRNDDDYESTSSISDLEQARKSAAWQAYLAYKESKQQQQATSTTPQAEFPSMTMSPEVPSASSSFPSDFGSAMPDQATGEEPPRSTSTAYQAYLAYKAQQEKHQQPPTSTTTTGTTMEDDHRWPDIKASTMDNVQASDQPQQRQEQQPQQQRQQQQQQQGQPQQQQGQQQQKQPRRPPPRPEPVYKHSVTNDFESRLSKLHSGNQVVQPRVRPPKSSQSQQQQGPRVRSSSSSSNPTSGGGGATSSSSSSQQQQQPLVQSGGGAWGEPDFLDAFNKRAEQLHQQSQSGALSGGYSSFDESGGRVPSPNHPQQQQQRSNLVSSGTGAWEDPHYQREQQQQQSSSSNNNNKPKGGEQPLVSSGGGAWGEPDFLDLFEQRASKLHQETQQEGYNSPQQQQQYHDQRQPQQQQQNQQQWQQQSSYSGGGNEPLVQSGGGYDALGSFEQRAAKLHSEGPMSGMSAGGGGGGGMMNHGGGPGMSAPPQYQQQQQGPSNPNRGPQQRWSPGADTGGSEPLVSQGGGYDFLKQFEERTNALHTQGAHAFAPRMDTNDFFKAQAGGTGGSSSGQSSSRNAPPPRSSSPPPAPQKPKEQPLVSTGGGAWGEPDFLDMFEKRASQLHQETQQEGFNAPPSYQDDPWQQQGQQQDPWQQQQQHQGGQQWQNNTQFSGNEPLVQSGAGYDALASFEERANKLHAFGPQAGMNQGPNAGPNRGPGPSSGGFGGGGGGGQRWQPGSTQGLVQSGGGYDALSSFEERAKRLHVSGAHAGATPMSSQDYFKAQSVSGDPGATVVSSDIGSPVQQNNTMSPPPNRPPPMPEKPKDQPLMSSGSGAHGVPDFLDMFEKRASQLHQETQQEGFNSPQQNYQDQGQQQQQEQGQWQNSQFSGPQDENDFLAQFEERSNRLHALGPRADSPTASRGGGSPGRGGNPTQGNPAFGNNGMPRPQGPSMPQQQGGPSAPDFLAMFEERSNRLHAEGPMLSGMHESSTDATPRAMPTQMDKQPGSESEHSFMKMIEDRKKQAFGEVASPGPSRPGFVDMLKKSSSEKLLGDTTLEIPGCTTPAPEEEATEETEAALGPPGSSDAKLRTAVEDEDGDASADDNDDFNPMDPLQMGIMDDLWAPDLTSILQHQMDEQLETATDSSASSDDPVPEELTSLHKENTDNNVAPSSEDHLPTEFAGTHQDEKGDDESASSHTKISVEKPEINAPSSPVALTSPKKEAKADASLLAASDPQNRTVAIASKTNTTASWNKTAAEPIIPGSASETMKQAEKSQPHLADTAFVTKRKEDLGGDGNPVARTFLKKSIDAVRMVAEKKAGNSTAAAKLPMDKTPDIKSPKGPKNPKKEPKPSTPQSDKALEDGRVFKVKGLGKTGKPQENNPSAKEETLVAPPLASSSETQDKSSSVADDVRKMLDSVKLPWTGSDDADGDESREIASAQAESEALPTPKPVADDSDAGVSHKAQAEINEAENKAIQAIFAADTTAPTEAEEVVTSAEPAADMPDFISQIERRRNRLHILSMDMHRKHNPVAFPKPTAQAPLPTANQTTVPMPQVETAVPETASQQPSTNQTQLVAAAPQSAPATVGKKRRSPRPDGEDFESMFDNGTNGLPGRGRPPIRRATPSNMTDPVHTPHNATGSRPPLKSEFTSHFDNRRNKLNKEMPK